MFVVCVRFVVMKLCLGVMKVVCGIVKRIGGILSWIIGCCYVCDIYFLVYVVCMIGSFYVVLVFVVLLIVVMMVY